MSLNFNNHLDDIPAEFLKNHNLRKKAEPDDIQISSAKKVDAKKNDNSNNFDNAWLVLMFIILFDMA